MNELQETIAHYRAQETNFENHVEAIVHYLAHAPNVENHADYQREARRMKIMLVLSLGQTNLFFKGDNLFAVDFINLEDCEGWVEDCGACANACEGWVQDCGACADA
ncbi:hypothetical protein Tco_0093571 [Tanacetum coccineum]